MLDRLHEVTDQAAFTRLSDDYYSWNSYNKTLLEATFSGPIRRDYDRPWSGVGGAQSPAEELKERESDIREYVRWLESIVERLPLWPAGSSETSFQKSAAGPKSVEPPKNVFIVHGHDHSKKQEVAGFLQRLKIESVILHEQTSESRTIIEKLEYYASQVGFAVVIVSPDDVGSVAVKADDFTGRARQNVVFEKGYFMGLLGRSRVCALFVGEVEKPSDIDGVVYVGVANWRLDLAKELKAAGFAVDMNLAL